MTRLPLALTALLAATAAAAGLLDGPLDDTSYMIDLTSSQLDSGYAGYLLPPLLDTLASSGMTPARRPPADVIVTVATGSDAGRWMGTGAGRAWIYTMTVMVGISPEAHAIPDDRTPAFGVRARLLTPNPDREDELDCMIRLAARTAIANYRPAGLFETDGASCLRR